MLGAAGPPSAASAAEGEAISLPDGASFDDTCCSAGRQTVVSVQRIVEATVNFGCKHACNFSLHITELNEKMPAESKGLGFQALLPGGCWRVRC